MPRCPDCRGVFATLPDEDGMHDCPYCGAPGQLVAPPDCCQCGQPYHPGDSDADDPQSFCGQTCEGAYLERSIHPECPGYLGDGGPCRSCAELFARDAEVAEARALAHLTNLQQLPRT